MVLNKGWGERHPLAKGGWFRRFVPREFTLVYAPRTEDDLEAVMQIVAASIWWVSGVDVKEDGEGDKRRNENVAAIGAAMQNKDCWACKLRGCGTSKVEQMTETA
jgi:hypothetical protein